MNEIPYQDTGLAFLTDDTGLLQHGKYHVPDPRHGYSTDDNARALILAVRLYEKMPDPRYRQWIYRYAGFLLGAQNPNGRFRNFMNYDRRWLEKEGSADCTGRCIWGISEALVSPAVSIGVKKMLVSLLAKALPAVRTLEFVKSQAYALLGLAALLRHKEIMHAWSDGWAAGGAEQVKGSTDLEAVAAELSKKLLQSWDAAQDGDWHWFEDVLTYSNAMVPWALLRYAAATGQEEARQVGLAALDFLAIRTIRQEIFYPIGCQGWWPKTAAVGAVFDQQPLEAFEMMAACQEADRLTGEHRYKTMARVAFAWYEGRNIIGQSMIDPDTGGCFDGITVSGVNENLGAESQIAWGLACMAGDS